MPPQRQRRPVDAVTLHNCRQTTLHHARRRPMGIGTRSLVACPGRGRINCWIDCHTVAHAAGRVGVGFGDAGPVLRIFRIAISPDPGKDGESAQPERHRDAAAGNSSKASNYSILPPISPFLAAGDLGSRYRVHPLPRPDLRSCPSPGYPHRIHNAVEAGGSHGARQGRYRRHAALEPPRQAPTSLPLPQTTTLRITRQDCRCQASPAVFLPWRPINPRPIDWMLDIRATLELMNGTSGYGNSAPSSTRI